MLNCRKAAACQSPIDKQRGRRMQHACMQVLSNPRSRELYDLSISKEHSVLRRAAAAGVHGG